MAALIDLFHAERSEQTSIRREWSIFSKKPSAILLTCNESNQHKMERWKYRNRERDSSAAANTPLHTAATEWGFWQSPGRLTPSGRKLRALRKDIVFNIISIWRCVVCRRKAYLHTVCESVCVCVWKRKRAFKDIQLISGRTSLLAASHKKVAPPPSLGLAVCTRSTRDVTTHTLFQLLIFVLK